MRSYKGTYQTELLDCGHIATFPRSEITTGYGTTKDGKKHCFFCCSAIDLTRMHDSGEATLYLVQSKSNDGTREITNWPGILRFPVLSWTESKRGGGFGSSRIDAWFRGPDGHIWHGINRGDNEIARCKRTKATKL